jgi:hypothetical protein
VEDQLTPKSVNIRNIQNKKFLSTQRKKEYYDRSAKSHKPLTVGERVRIQINKLWKPALVEQKVNARSYIVSTDDGGSYRRNRRHLLKSNESPIIETNPASVRQDLRIPQSSLPIQLPSLDIPPISQPTEPNEKCINDNSCPTPKVTSPEPSKTNISQSTNKHESQPQNSPYITRSGRAVKAPQKFDL